MCKLIKPIKLRVCNAHKQLKLNKCWQTNTNCVRCIYEGCLKGNDLKIKYINILYNGKTIKEKLFPNKSNSAVYTNKIHI